MTQLRNPLKIKRNALPKQTILAGKLQKQDRKTTMSGKSKYITLKKRRGALKHE